MGSADIVCLLQFIIHHASYVIRKGDIQSGIYIFLYSSATRPWIISMNNFRCFTNISESRLPTNMYYISLERSYCASACFCCIKINAEMAEKPQVKHGIFMFTGASVYDSLFHILYLNMDICNS